MRKKISNSQNNKRQESLSDVMISNVQFLVLVLILFFCFCKNDRWPIFLKKYCILIYIFRFSSWALEFYQLAITLSSRLVVSRKIFWYFISTQMYVLSPPRVYYMYIYILLLLKCSRCCLLRKYRTIRYQLHNLHHQKDHIIIILLLLKILSVLDLIQ